MSLFEISCNERLAGAIDPPTFRVQFPILAAAAMKAIWTAALRIISLVLGPRIHHLGIAGLRFRLCNRLSGDYRSLGENKPFHDLSGQGMTCGPTGEETNGLVFTIDRKSTRLNSSHLGISY